MHQMKMLAQVALLFLNKAHDTVSTKQGCERNDSRLQQQKQFHIPLYSTSFR